MQQHRFPTKASQHGLTLLELMVTVAIIALVAVMSVNMSSVFQKNQISSYAQDLMAALQMARSEAVTRSTRVTVCKRDKTDPNQCGTDGNWNNGWLVFVDDNDDATVASSDKILRVHEPLKDQFDLTGYDNQIDNYVSFIGAGFPRTVGTGSGLQIGSLVLCDPRGYDNHARKIIISSTGQMRLVKGKSAEDTSGHMSCP